MGRAGRSDDPSFSDWYLVDRDQRTFARKGLEVSKEVYDRIWEELARQPGDPDYPELPDLFNDAVDGLWSHDFEWMHLAGVVKDAVTNFEVYLERGADEILQFQGKSFAQRPKSPTWGKLFDFYRLLGSRSRLALSRRPASGGTSSLTVGESFGPKNSASSSPRRSRSWTASPISTFEWSRRRWTLSPLRFEVSTPLRTPTRGAELRAPRSAPSLRIHSSRGVKGVAGASAEVRHSGNSGASPGGSTSLL